MTALPRHTFAVLIALGALTACKPTDIDPRLQAPLVRVMTVPEANTSVQAYTGVVVARVQSNLAFRVTGKVVERLVDTGQAVKAGQPLMRIDHKDFALTINVKEQAVAAAKARAVQAVASEQRYDMLSQHSAVSRESYEQAKAAADSARAQWAAAEAEAQIARNERSYTLLMADAEGIVIDTLAEPGQVVTAGETVIRLAHAGPREAAIHLPETVRPALASIAQATLYGSDNKSAVRLRQLSDFADTQTRTFEARYVLDGDMTKAALGTTVTVYLTSNAAAKTVEVPLGALTDKGKGPGVWVIDQHSSSVSFRAVEIASLSDENALIKNGVASNERIVALGAHLLHEGEAVRIDDRKILP